MEDKSKNRAKEPRYIYRVRYEMLVSSNERLQSYRFETGHLDSVITEPDIRSTNHELLYDRVVELEEYLSSLPDNSTSQTKGEG